MPPDRAAVYQARVDQFTKALTALCDEHSIPHYGLREAAAGAGFEVDRTGDGLHAALETRVWEASFLAGLILERLAAVAEKMPRRTFRVWRRRRGLPAGSR